MCYNYFITSYLTSYRILQERYRRLKQDESVTNEEDLNLSPLESGGLEERGPSAIGAFSN